jgi:hypothetical protein
MELEKSGVSKVCFNLSPSSLNLFYQSPLLFYLTHIRKVPDDTPVPLCYGLSGSIVHECLEKYAKKEIDMDGACMHLINQWEKQNMNSHKDINGYVLNISDYLNAVLKGMQIIDQHKDHICEEMITFPFKENEVMKIGLKGIIDLQATDKNNNEKSIIDYKTSNSISQDKNFERQALFYNFLLHKKKNFIPSKTSFHYLKLGAKKDHKFSLKEIEDFEKELSEVADKILFYGTDIENYPAGQIDDLFNSKKQACLREVQRRKKLDSQF